MILIVTGVCLQRTSFPSIRLHPPHGGDPVNGRLWSKRKFLMASPVDDDTGILVVRNMGVNAYQNQKAKNESDFWKHGLVCAPGYSYEHLPQIRCLEVCHFHCGLGKNDCRRYRFVFMSRTKRRCTNGSRKKKQ